MRAKRKGLFGDRRSVAAMEFALIAPLMVVMAGGVYDLCEGVIIFNEITSSATTIVASASSAAVNLDGSTALSYDQIQLAESGIWADIPELAGNRQTGNNKSVTLSSVTFDPPGTCKSGSSCNPYSAYVMWSVAYNGTGTGTTFVNNIRPCSPSGAQSNGLGGELQVSSSTALNQSNFTYTLPTLGVASYTPDPTGPAPILVADVVFTYTPLFHVLKSPITFVATALWPVRAVKPTSPLVNGGSTIQPLAQQFTKIYGVNTGGNFTPYAAPANAQSPTTTTESDYVAGTACINQYAASPVPYTTSST